MDVIINFDNEEQAIVFFEWFKTYGFDDLCENDTVNDDLSQNLFYKKIKQATHSSKTKWYIKVE